MPVKPLSAVVRLFVNTFGITQPKPETEALAGKIILAMLVGVLLMLAVIGWVLRSAFIR